VAVEGPITQTKWSHISLIFTEVGIKLVSFPHTIAMLIITHIDKWDVMRVLVDNGSQAELLFLSAFDHMASKERGLNWSVLYPSYYHSNVSKMQERNS
jgi:hypothetical protein